MPRSITQIRRALSSLAFNLTDLEGHIDIEAFDAQLNDLETLAEEAQESKDEEEEKENSDDEEEDSSADE